MIDSLSHFFKNRKMASADDASTAPLRTRDDDLAQAEWVPGNVRRVTLACCFAQAAFGYSFVIPYIAPSDIVASTSAWESFTLLYAVQSASMIGVIVGAILILLASRWTSRKMGVGLGTLLVGIGAIVQVSSPTSTQFTAGRALAGIGGGFVVVCAPVWQIEVSNTRKKAKLCLPSIRRD